MHCLARNDRTILHMMTSTFSGFPAAILREYLWYQDVLASKLFVVLENAGTKIYGSKSEYVEIRKIWYLRDQISRAALAPARTALPLTYSSQSKLTGQQQGIVPKVSMLISNIKLALSSLAERIDHGARAMSARRSGVISLQVNREELPVQQSLWVEAAACQINSLAAAAVVPLLPSP